MNILQIVGYANSGKTTLICRLVAALKEANRNVATIKHHAHASWVETADKDTRQHRQSGADVSALLSPRETLVVRSAPRPLARMVEEMREQGADCLLIEGFKREIYPKIVLVKREEDYERLKRLSNVVAFGAWPGIYERVKAKEERHPVFSIDDWQTALSFIL